MGGQFVANRRVFPALVAVGLIVFANIALWSVLLVTRSSTDRPVVDPAEVVHGERVRSTVSGAQPVVDASIQAAAGGEPAITMPVSYRNLGTVRPGERVDVSFAVQNTGEGALLVERLDATSPLLAAELSSAVIPPGRTALLTVTFDAAHGGDHTSAMLRRGIVIHSNDRRQPHAEVWVQATIAP